jgi:drug/metabolite transporter (DMT)-like permease
VFSGLIDWLVWRVLPDALFLAGAVLVVAAAVLTLRLRAARPPAAAPGSLPVDA